MQQRLIQEQALQWKMNQSLLQAIQLLQFSSAELMDYIKEVANENPLVEDVETNYDFSAYNRGNDTHPDLGDINPAEVSMYEKLKGQLFTLDVPENMLPIVDYGIDSLDETGYLSCELKTWAEDCDVSLEIAERALSIIQSLEPVGIGARSFQECIILQLRAMDEHTNTEIAANVLENHLEWIANNEVEMIAEEYGLPEKDASGLIDNIRACHPKPGNLLASQKANYIIPEAAIVKEEGQWKISFYKWSKPTITINHSYEKMTDLEKIEKDYLKEKRQQIDWLNQAISYRVNSLERIIRQVIQKQFMYFDKGVEWLQPLTLKEVADELDISISTVSRSIQNKYVQTSSGVLPIKFFFPRGIEQKNGKTTAAFAIKQIIATIIQTEDKQKPLSDEGIRQKLSDDYDIDIARRTVMKYRKQLRIPSSMKRK